MHRRRTNATQALAWRHRPYSSYVAALPAGDLALLSAALQAFTSTGNLHGGSAVHAQIITLPYLSPRSFSLWNKLLHFYLSCGHPRAARLVFDQMPVRDVISYNTLIWAHARHNTDPDDGALLYRRMLEEGLMPNNLTLAALLSGYNPAKDPSLLPQLHSHSVKFGLISDKYVGGALVSAYEKFAGLEFAVRAFDDIPCPDQVLWNIMIDACARSGSKEMTVAILSRMRLENGGEFDGFALTSALKTCSELSDLNLGAQLHCCALKLTLDTDTPTGNALLTMYSRCDESMDPATKLVERIREPNIISWTAMIGAFMQHGMAEAATHFYRHMLRAGVLENEFSFASVLPAFGELSSVKHGRMVHSRVLKSVVGSDIGVGNALMDMYFKCGSLEDARRVFETMEDIDSVSWTIMIYGYGQHGKGKEALRLFEMMKNGGFTPDGVSFLGALSSCSHSGLVSEGVAIFESMVGEYGMKPAKEHYACLVDLYGRAGRLEGAERFIKEMGVEADAVVWEALLGVCEIYGEVEVGRRAAEKLMALKPGSSGSYVSLSNIYAEQKMWEEKGEVRRRLDESGVRKEVAESRIG